MSTKSYFVPSGTSIKDLTDAEREAIKSLFFNRGHRAMVHTTDISATAEWYNVAGKYTIKVEVDATPLA